VKKQYGFLFLFYLLFSCKQEGSEPLFSLLSESQTGISFRNDLVYTEKINPYTFRNFYNGAGVAIGDINQDSLPDIFLLETSKATASTSIAVNSTLKTSRIRQA